MIHHQQLKNGLHVVTCAMDHVHSTTCGLWIGVGSRYETPRLNGAAHYLEHMLFKGTETRSAFDIAHQVEKLGGYINAYTGREQTAYYVKTLSEDKNRGIEILADIFLRPSLSQEQMDIERNVILQEMAQSIDTPDDIIYDHLYDQLFAKQGLGQPVLGRDATVKSMQPQDLRTFLQSYHPERTLFCIAGRAEHTETMALAEEYFTDIPYLDTLPKEDATFTPGDHFFERPIDQSHVLLACPGMSRLSKKRLHYSLYAILLGGGMSSPLFQTIREKNGLAYSTYSFHHSFSDTGLFGIYAATQHQHVDEVRQLARSVLKDQAHSLTRENVEVAQKQMQASVLMGLDHPGSRAESTAYQILTHSRPIDPQELGRMIADIRFEDIQSVAHTLAETPWSMIHLGQKP